MEIINDFLPRTEFENYADFKENFKINTPRNFDFARDVVDKWAKYEPDKLALLYCDDDGNEKRITFAQVSDLSKRAATYFLSLGIKSGDRVLTLMRRRWEYWICAVALHRMGAVVVPASIQLKRKDISYRINAAGAKAIIAIDDSYVISQISDLCSECESLDNLILVGENGVPDGFCDFKAEYDKCSPYRIYSGLSNDDEMVVYFTSGTSGYPKMAIHDRTYPLGHIVTARYMQCVQNNGLHLTQSDSGWAKFGWGNIYGQWICGSAILAYDPIRFNSTNLMNAMKRFKPTSLCIPPTMYRFLMHDGLTREHVESIKWYSTAGEALSGEVNNEFYLLSGHRIHEGYGQSEGTPITCGFEWLAIRPASMGKPSPLYKTAIIRPDGTKCNRGEEGEVVILTGNRKQLGLLRWYGDENGNKTSPIESGVYHTGDTAYEDEDGYYWYVGRTDDMIKCSGYRIGPFEIESVLNTHPAVKESAIVGYPDEIRGQIVCAAIVLKDGFEGSPELTAELQAYVKKNTAPYKYPRVVKYIPVMPKTTSGKIIRKEVKALVNPEA